MRKVDSLSRDGYAQYTRENFLENRRRSKRGQEIIRKKRPRNVNQSQEAFGFPFW